MTLDGEAFETTAVVNPNPFGAYVLVGRNISESHAIRSITSVYWCARGSHITGKQNTDVYGQGQTPVCPVKRKQEPQVKGFRTKVRKMISANKRAWNADTDFTITHVGGQNEAERRQPEARGAGKAARFAETANRLFRMEEVVHFGGECSGTSASIAIEVLREKVYIPGRA